MTTIKHMLVGLLLFFFLSSTLSAQTLADTIEAKVNGAVREGRIVDQLSNQFTQFPKGEFLLAPQNKNLNYGIIIYNIDILPDRAIFSAAIAFRDPKSNQLIAFKADRISFSNTRGLTGPVQLFLLSDIQINFGNSAEILLYAGQRNTYATFDCLGLREFSIAGKVQFNSQLLLPVDALGNIENNKKLSAEFEIKAKHWSDLIVQISLQPFQIKGLKDFVFTISEASMDLSETNNCSNMLFPSIYNNELQDLRLWEGFYLKKGSVKLPPHFKTNDQKRTEFGVINLLIDEWGFSGILFGKNILQFDEGHLGDWPFSISNLEIGIIRNEITSGKMEGELGLPILPDTSRLGYKGYISSNDNYGFQISVNKNLCIPAFKISKLTLTPNSYIDMAINDGELILESNFNGQLAIEHQSNPNDNSPSFHFPAIEFQGLRAANHEPKFDISYLGLKNTNSNGQQIGKYPLQIERIGLSNLGNNKVIQIKCIMNLMEKIAVKAGVSIEANYTNQHLKFKGMQMDAIDINSQVSCFTMNGQLNFIKQDAIYGNGLSGSIQFKMNQPKINASASLMFGSINQHRYWYFDANAMWDQPGIPFLPGAEINGFIGGAWQGMREKNLNDPLSNNELGLTASGKYYTPDPKVGLGFRAGIYIRSTGGSNESKPFIAKTAIEIQFNRNMGMNQLSIFGNADFMTKNTALNTTDLKQNTSALPSQNNWKTYIANYRPIGNFSSPFSLNFDFAQQVYQANFAVYIQGIAQNKLQGYGPRGLAGEVSAYFSISKWYLWLGTPQQPLGIKMNIGKAGTASINAYFMAGKDLPASAPLPIEITSILGSKNTDAMRNLEALNVGNAFSFGSRATLEIGSEGGEKNISIYASLKALLGFDLNVRPTNNNTICSSNNEQPGINGWFANGQLFAFLQGRVGASVQTKTIKSKFDLLTLTTAAQLYCEGPKPFYSNGSSSIKVNIAGIINKQMKLNFEIGEPCSIQQNKLSDTSIILSSNIENNATNIVVSKSISTQFSIPVNSNFQDADGRNLAFNLKQYELTDNTNLIPGQIKFNSSKNQVSFESNDLLPANKKLKLKIVVIAQLVESTYELRNNNNIKLTVNPNEQNIINQNIEKMKAGQLSEFSLGNNRKLVRVDKFKPYQLNGASVSETKEIYFTTGAAPSGILESNIAYTYPIKDQLNYHISHSADAFVQLQKGQSNLTIPTGYKMVALIADNNGNIISEANAILNNKRINHKVPGTLLKNNRIYQIIFKIKSINSKSEIGNNLSNTNSNFNTSISAVNKSSTNMTSTDKVIYYYYFGTSDYSNFTQKMQSISSTNSVINNLSIQTNMKSSLKEYFDAFEIINQPNLINIENTINSNTWFGAESKKLYSIFKTNDQGLLSLIDLNRDTTELGLIPTKAVKIKQNNSAKMKLMSNGLNGFKKPTYLEESFEINNYSADIMSRDLEAIKTALIQYINSPSFSDATMNKLLNNFSQTNTLQGLKSFNNSNGNSISSLNISINSSLNNTTLPNGINQQKSNWLIRIDQLQLNPLVNQNFVYQFNYLLPGNLKPILSYQINLKSSKE